MKLILHKKPKEGDTVILDGVVWTVRDSDDYLLIETDKDVSCSETLTDGKSVCTNA